MKNICFCIGENYLQYFIVSLYSLLINNNNYKINIFLISDCDNNFKITKIKDYFYNTFSIKIKYLKIDSEYFLPLKITHHINHSTYYRLILSEILPKNINQVLYLDSDTIINDDISPIFNLKFDEKTYIYASDHFFNPEQKIHLRNFGLSEFDNYFNAGVLYIDLKKWREKNISKTLMEFALKKKDDILWWDQDVLNVIFYKKWKKLHPKYNVIWEILESESDDPEIIEARKNPVIIHYTRSVKPWHDNSYHPLRHLYWKYRNKLPHNLLEILA